jgi:hypothetical protein
MWELFFIGNAGPILGLCWNAQLINGKKCRCQTNIIPGIFCITVGAQSLPSAQSIACGHIGDNICQKNKIIEKLCLHKIRRGNSAADS